MISRTASLIVPSIQRTVPVMAVFSRSAYCYRKGYDYNFTKDAEELLNMKRLYSLNPRVNDALTKYHFPKSVRTHVETRSIKPNRSTKRYIRGMMDMIENRNLTECGDITVDPMNRYSTII